MLTKDECDTFISDVVANGSRLPMTDISVYVPTCRI